MIALRRLSLGALLLIAGLVPSFAQIFQSLGSASLSVTNVSGNVVLPGGQFGNNITVLNVGSTEAFVSFGGSTVTAATTNESVPANSGRCFQRTTQTYLAGITASGSTTLRIGQGSGPCSISVSGPGGGAVTNAGTFATQSSQAGTWTVQPGNTANTTPWLVSSGASETGGATYRRIAPGQATTVVKASAGTLYSICLNSAATATNTTTVYDNASGAGTIIAVPAVTTATVPTCLAYGPAGIAFTLGLTVITATANGGDMTLAFK